jgi:hypothetical protein
MTSVGTSSLARRGIAGGTDWSGCHLKRVSCRAVVCDDFDISRNAATAWPLYSLVDGRADAGGPFAAISVTCGRHFESFRGRVVAPR